MLNRRNVLKALGGIAAASLTAAAEAVPVGKPKEFDKSFDVLVVGAGAAGLSAAHNALDAGLTVAVFEKLGIPGGSSAICGGQWAVSNSKYQQKQGIKDSDALFVEDMLKTGQHVNDKKLVEAFVKASRDEFNWVTSHGVEPYQVGVNAGMSVPRSHYFKPADIIMMMADYVQKKGGKLLYETKAERLLWDADKNRICGVRVSAKGKTFNYEAKKGVVLAAGGFSRNPALLKKYAPLMTTASVIAGAGTQGDGLLMAQAYGADVLDANYIKATYGYILNPKVAADKSASYYAGAIMVNKGAKRFVNESLSYKLLGDAALAQKDGASFLLFDDVIRKAAMKADKRDARFWGSIDKDGKTPFAYVGQTIADVARQAGLDPKTLEETVRTYNETAPAGKDAFGRTSLSSGFGKPLPIRKAPFVLMPATASLIATYCGVRIDTQARVIDVFGEPIMGLYAAGEMTGGVHGAAYMSGTALGKAYAFGRIAAQTIASGK